MTTDQSLKMLENGQIPWDWDFNLWANVTGFHDRFFEIQENVRKILENTNLNTILAGVGIGLLLILGIVIIVNQIRIRKQLRRILEQLEQKEEMQDKREKT